jgi:PadR family transcriptional regulator PadR
LSFRHGGPGHRKSRHDFWREWRDEQRRLRHEHGPDFVPPLPPTEMAHAWREFFSEFMGALPEDHWFFGGRRFSPWHQGMDTFNPFVASLLSKGGGLLPLYVMQLAAQKPRYGNEIMEIIAERTGGQWVSNPGAIYPLLNLLEEQHLIEGVWEDPQKRTIRIYSLTEEGVQELARLKAIVRPKLTEAIKVLQGLEHDLNGHEGNTTAEDIAAE